MKKTYQTPELICHGGVSEITAYSFDSSRQDTFFGPPDGTTPIQSGTGSLDACLIPPQPGDKNCL